MQRNGIRAFRKRAGISQSELARRVGTSRQQIGRLEEGHRELTIGWASSLAEVLKCNAYDLMFPEKAKLDGVGYLSIFIGDDSGEDQITDQAISIPEEIVKEIANNINNSRLELIRISSLDIAATAARGDYLLVDRSVNSVEAPGVYQVQINAAKYWRYLTPSATGQIIIKSDDERIAVESVDKSRLVILGRAFAKLAAI